jgi:PAS domain S-box-containing protein
MKSQVRGGKVPSLNNLLFGRVITAAVLSLVITAGLALLFYPLCKDSLHNFPLRQSINSFLPGLFELVLFVGSALLFLVFLLFLFLRRVLPRLNEASQPLPDSGSEPVEDGIEAFSTLMDKQGTLAPEPAPQVIGKDRNPAAEALELELKSERLLNDLLAALLSREPSAGPEGIDELLTSLGTYCRSEYAAIYRCEGGGEVFHKIGSWDSDPETARHSPKVDSIQLSHYRWMHRSFNSGKSFIFRTAMLESLMEGVTNAAEDVKAWMRMQAQESAEYKLCRHEGWDYFVCFPCRLQDEITGLFLIGYQKKELPVTNDILERLTLISSALGRQLAPPEEKPLPVAETAVTDLQATLDALDDAVFTTDRDGIITVANKAAAALAESTPERMAGQPWHNVLHLISRETRFPVPNPINKLNREFGIKVYLEDALLVTTAGREILLEGMAAAYYPEGSDSHGVIFILRDVTERVRQENERCQAQRMEAISSLSAGFAHDFNNILTAILGNISLAMDDAPPNSEQASLLKAAEESTLKGKAITDNLLAMAKGSPVPDYSSEAVQALQRVVTELVAGTNVKPVFQIGANLPNIKMAVETFEKIIANLVTNALQAMKLGGVLTVTAELFNAVSDTEIKVKPGHYLCIHIKDTGEGISSENQNRVFVPYFTTRPQATGLGLPIVYSLLKKHDGFIRLKSQPGKGTDCEIYIPVANGEAEAKPDSRPEPQPAPARSAPLVLVLDEDDALGNLLIKTLVKMGLKVQHTTNTDELTTLFFKAAQGGTPVNLIIADLNLPSLIDIQNLLGVLKKSDPKVKLVAYSNQLGPDNLEEYKGKGFDDILQKPFNISDLRSVITRNLEL